MVRPSGRQKSTQQKSKIKLHPRLDEVPLYVRAGAIVPMQPVGNLPLKAKRADPSCAPTCPSTSGPDAGVNACRGALYEDDGTPLSTRRARSFESTIHARSASAL